MDRKLLSERSKSIESCKVPKITIKDFGAVFKKTSSPPRLVNDTERFLILEKPSNIRTPSSKSPQNLHLQKLASIPRMGNSQSNSPNSRSKNLAISFAVAPNIKRENFRINYLADLSIKNSYKKFEQLGETSKNLSPKSPISRNHLFAFRTQTGVNSGRSKEYNQDSFLIVPNFTNSQKSCLFGVMDGHGSHGHLISNYLKSSIPSSLSQVSQFLSSNPSSTSLVPNLKSLIKSAFHSLQTSLTAHTPILTYLSGSTTTLVLIQDSTCICSNLGDSRAVLGRVENTWTAVALSNDHKPCNLNEKKRIEKAGGRVEACVDAHGNYAGPQRVWIKNEMRPGLAVSRSFGDVIASSVGVSSEPEVRIRELDGLDRFIVVGTDGVWDVMNNVDVVKLVGRCFDRGNVENAADELMKKCLQRWKKMGGGMDDITFVILFLK